MKFGLRTLAVMAAACVILVASTSTSSVRRQQNQQQQKLITVKSHRQHPLRFRPVPIVGIPLRIGGSGGSSNTKPSSSAASSSLETNDALAKGTQEFNNNFISKDEQQKDNGPVGQQQTNTGEMGSGQPTISSSSLFAGLLVDQQAFFFPMDMSSSTLSESASAPTPAVTSKSKSKPKQKKEHKLRRNLKSKEKQEKETDQPTGIVDDSAATSVWSWIVAGEASNGDGKVKKHKTKTKKNATGKLDGHVMKSLAAVGPYYSTKSTILMDFYNETDRSNDLSTIASTTSTGGNDVSSDSSVPSDPDRQFLAPSITADWKCDVQRGTQIADAYKNIGLLIDAHYKDSVQKCSSCVGETKSDCPDPSEKEPCGIEWSEDSKRGLDIANQYKILGKIVADHYSALENAINSSTIAEPTQSSSPFESCIAIPTGSGDNGDQATTSMYVSDGMIVADYYRKKAQLVQQYYNPSLVEFTQDGGSNAGTDAETGVATGLEQDPSLLRLLEQGEAIHQYYRASMDSASYQKDLSRQWDELLANDPDLIFPPWGFDWHTDREHGIAIGKYWHLRHKLEREQYTVQGQGLTDYYSDFYQKALLSRTN